MASISSAYCSVKDTLMWTGGKLLSALRNFFLFGSGDSSDGERNKLFIVFGSQSSGLFKGTRDIFNVNEPNAEEKHLTDIRCYRIRSATDHDEFGLVIECSLSQSTDSVEENKHIMTELNEIFQTRERGPSTWDIHLLILCSLKDDRFVGPSSYFANMVRDVKPLIQTLDERNKPKKALVLTDANYPTVVDVAREKTEQFVKELQVHLNGNSTISYSCEEASVTSYFHEFFSWDFDQIIPMEQMISKKMEVIPRRKKNNRDTSRRAQKGNNGLDNHKITKHVSDIRIVEIDFEKPRLPDPTSGSEDTVKPLVAVTNPLDESVGATETALECNIGTEGDYDEKVTAEDTKIDKHGNDTAPEGSNTIFGACQAVEPVETLAEKMQENEVDLQKDNEKTIVTTFV